MRLLAEVAADLYKQKLVSPLIQSALVNLTNQSIRREFIKHIGNEYETVITADISGGSAKASKIDKEMGSEYERYGIAKGIASSIFLYSFSAGASKETTLPRIRVALLRNCIPATIVGDAVAKLEEELWYLHSESKQYAFRVQPNLNRVIVDKEETIADERIQEEIKELIQKKAGHAVEVYLWPQEFSDIPDNKNIKLAILSSTYFYGSEKGRKFISELFEKAGAGFRIYKNTLFILQTDNNQYISLNKALRRFLALQEIQNDRNFIETLTPQSQEELKKKIKEMNSELPFKILTAYRHLTMLEDGGINFKDLGIPTAGSDQTISERIKQYLKDQEKLLIRITPKYLLDKTFSKDENEKTLREIYELFLKVPGMPLLESESVLIEAVREGVKTGILGIRENTMIYYKQDVSVNMDSIIMRGETAEQQKEEKSEEEISSGQRGTASIIQVSSPEKLPISSSVAAKRIQLEAVIPWDSLSHIINGVIRPLKDKGDPPEITIKISAESKEGYDETTLESRVKETLRQIKAEIKEWKLE